MAGVEQNDPSFFEYGVENATLIINEDNSFEDYRFQPDKSFHSIDSKSSIVRNIEELGVEHDTSLSNSTKRGRAMALRNLPLML